MQVRMRTVSLLIAIVCLSGRVDGVEPDDQAVRPAEAQLRPLVEQLGSRSYRVRSEATRQLLEAGASGAEAIGRWLDRNDPEATARARRILYALTEGDDVAVVLASYAALARIAGDSSAALSKTALLRREMGAFLQQNAGPRLQAREPNLSAVTSLTIRRCTGRGALVLVYLKHLPNLERLSLENSNATDTTIRYLQPPANLKSLNLSATQITDQALGRLSALGNLQSLYLSDTAVTDAGLVHLKTLPKLRVLWLDRTKITDTGLKHLGELKALRFLHVSGTAVGEASLERLRRDRPQIKVIP